MSLIFFAPLLRCLAIGAKKRNRTVDLFLTKEVLYLLSYLGLLGRMSPPEDASPRFEGIGHLGEKTRIFY